MDVRKFKFIIYIHPLIPFIMNVRKFKFIIIYSLIIDVKTSKFIFSIYIPIYYGCKFNTFSIHIY